MDQKQLSDIIAKVYKSLTPARVEISEFSAEMATVRVVSSSFKGMGASARISLLSNLFESVENQAFNERVYLLEGFTPEEALNLPIDSSDEDKLKTQVGSMKKSALEPNA